MQGKADAMAPPGGPVRDRRPRPGDALALEETLGTTLGVSSGPVRQAIAASAALRHVAQGDFLLREGAPSDDMHVLISGRLRAVRSGPDGTRLLGDIAPGETVGELGLATGRPRSADVIALRDSVVATFDREAIRLLVAAHPDFAFSMTRFVAERYERQQASPRRMPGATTLAFDALTPGLDLSGIARALELATKGFSHRAVALAVADPGPGVDIDTLIETAGAGAATLFFRLSGTAGDAALLPRADEVILFARAGATPLPEHARRVAEARGAPAGSPLARRVTLALIHDDDARSPRDTARWLDALAPDRHVHCRGADASGLTRLARIVTGRARGFVLSGGGARGFAHLGACKALAEYGIRPDLIGGTSFGAIAAFWLSMGLEGDDLIAEGRRTFVETFRGRPTSDISWLPLISLIRGKRAEETGKRSIRRLAGDLIDIEDAWISTFVIASNYTRICETVLDRGSYARNLMASFAIPGALPPVLIDGEVMYDGGCFNNFPVDVMAARGAGAIIGIDLSVDRARRIDAEVVPGTLALLVDRMKPRNRRRYRFPGILETLTNSAFMSAIARQRSLRGEADLLLRPRISGVGMLQWRRFDHAVRQGYDHTRSVLDAMDPEAIDRLL